MIFNKFISLLLAVALSAHVTNSIVWGADEEPQSSDQEEASNNGGHNNRQRTPATEGESNSGRGGENSKEKLENAERVIKDPAATPGQIKEAQEDIAPIIHDLQDQIEKLKKEEKTENDPELKTLLDQLGEANQLWDQLVNKENKKPEKENTPEPVITPKPQPESKASPAQTASQRADNPNSGSAGQGSYLKKYGRNPGSLLKDPKYGDPTIGQGPSESNTHSPKTQAVLDSWLKRIKTDSSLSPQVRGMLADGWLYYSGGDAQKELAGMGVKPEDAADLLRVDPDPKDETSGARKIGFLEEFKKDPELSTLSFSDPSKIPTDIWQKALPNLPANVQLKLRKSDSMSPGERRDLVRSVEAYLSKTKPPENASKGPVTDQSLREFAAREALAKFVLSEYRKGTEAILETAGIKPEFPGRGKDLLAAFETKGTQLWSSLKEGQLSRKGSYDEKLHGFLQETEKAIAEASTKGAPIKALLNKIAETGHALPPPLASELAKNLNPDHQKALLSALENKEVGPKKDFQQALSNIVLNPTEQSLQGLVAQTNPYLAHGLSQQASFVNQALNAAATNLKGFVAQEKKLQELEAQRLKELPEAEREKLRLQFEEQRQKRFQEAIGIHANHRMDSAVGPVPDEMLKEWSQEIASELGLEIKKTLTELERARELQGRTPVVAALLAKKQEKLKELEEQFTRDLDAAKTPEEKEKILKKYGPQFQELGELSPGAKKREQEALEVVGRAELARLMVQQQHQQPHAEAGRALQEEFLRNQKNLKALQDFRENPSRAEDLRDPSFSEWLRGQGVTVDLRDYTHLRSGNRELEDLRGRLLDRQQQLLQLQTSPENHPLFAIVKDGAERKDLPVTRKVWRGPEYEALGGAEVRPGEWVQGPVEKTGTYSEWKSQQDETTIRYLETYRDSQTPEAKKALKEAETFVKAASERATAISSENETAQRELTERFWGGLWEKMGSPSSVSPEDLAKTAANIQTSFQEMGAYAAAINPAGSSRSPEAAKYAEQALSSWKEQIVNKAVGAGIPRELAENMIAQVSAGQKAEVARMDTDFQQLIQRAPALGIEVGAFSITPLSSRASMSEVQTFTEDLEKSSGRGYYGSLWLQAALAEREGGAFQINKDVTLQIKNPEQFRRGLAEGKLEGIVYTPTATVRNQHQRYADEAAEIRKRILERNGRPSADYEGTRAADEKDMKRLAELGKLMESAGNVELAVRDQSGKSVWAPANHVRQSLSHELNTQLFETVVSNIVRSRSQEDAMISTYAKTGVALAAIPLTWGASSLPLLMAGGASWAVVGTVGTQSVMYSWEKSIGRDPHWDWVSLNKQVDRQALQGGLTAGASRGFGSLGFSNRWAGVAGAVGAGGVVSRIYGDTPEQFLQNAVMHAVFAGTGPEFLSGRFGSTRFALAAGEAYLANFAPSALVDTARTIAGGGKYQSVTGQQYDFYKNPLEWFGSVVAGNSAGDIIGTARARGTIQEKINSRLANLITTDPAVATRLPPAQVERVLSTMSSPDLASLGRRASDPDFRNKVQEALVARTLTEAESAVRGTNQPNGVTGWLKRIWTGEPPPPRTPSRLALEGLTPEAREQLGRRVLESLDEKTGRDSKKVSQTMEQLGFKPTEIESLRAKSVTGANNSQNGNLFLNRLTNNDGTGTNEPVAAPKRNAFKKTWDRVVGLFNRPPPTSSNQLKPLRLTGPGSVEPKKPPTLTGPTSSPRASPESASDAFQSAIAAGKTPQQAVNELRTRGFSIPSIEEAQNTYLDLIAKGKVPDITAPASVKSSDFAPRRDDARKEAKAYFESKVQSMPLQELKTLLERAKEFGLFGYVAERVEARIALQTQITETLKNALRLADDPSKKMAEAIIRAPLGQELLNGVAGRSASEIETQIRSRLRAELGTKTRLPEPAVKNLAQAFEDYLAPGQSNGPRPWPSRGFVVIDNSQGKVEGNLKEAPKFVTLNTEGMKNTDGVAQVLKQQVEAGAKIIVLQEVPDLKTLQKVMAEAGMGSFSTHLTKEGNQRLAILASSEIAMDRDKGEVGKGAGGKPFYTKTELDLGRSSDGDSQKLVVFGVHLKAFDDPESYQLRQEQLSKLRGAVEAESARSGGRVLVLGDFNLVGSRENNASRSRSKEVEATVRAFEELGLTRMQFENPKGGRPTNRWRNAGARTLDFVFVGKGLAPEGGLRVTNGMGAAELPGGVVNTEKKASDHSGIAGSLTVLKPQYQSPKPSGVSSESDAAPTPAPKLSTTDFGKDSYQRVQTQMKKQIDAWIREAEASGQTKRAEVLRSHQDHVNAMVKYVDEHYRQLVADGYNPERLKAAILTHDIGKFVDADPLVAQRHTLRIFQDVKSEKAIQFLRETKGMSKADAEAFLERVRSTPGNRPKAVLSQLSEVDQKIITEAATNPKARNFFAEFMDHAETSREWMRKNPFGGALGKPDEVTRQMMLDSYGHDGPAIPGSWWGANYKSVTGRNYARVWTETGELLRGYDRANQSHLDWAGQQLGGGPRKIAIQVLDGADTPEAHVKAIREGLTSVPKGTQVQLDSLKSEGKIPGYIADQIQKSITDVELLRANTVFYGEKGLAPQGAPEGGIGHVKVGDEIVYFRNTDEFFGTEKKVGAAGRFWKSEIQSQPASKAGITPVTPRPPPESLAVPAERQSPLLDQLAAKVLGAAGPTRSSPRPSEDLPDTQLRPGEETSLSPKQQKQLQKMQRQISRWFVDDVHQLREAYRRIGQEVPDWLADKKVVGKMVDLFNSISEKRGTIPPRDEVGVILQRENDLQELMKRGVPYAVAYRLLDLASGVWTAYNGKNAFPAEVEGQRGTQLHKLPGIISAELEAQGVRFRELSFEQQQRKVEAVLQKLFPGDKALAHLRSPFQVQDEQSNWGPLDKTVEYIVSKAYAVTYGGEPSLSHTTRYRTVPVDPAKVLGPDGAVNRQAVEEILGRQQKETVVHTAQNPQEGIKFVQENAQKKGQTTLPLVIKFLSGLETDVLVGSGPALERVIRAWGPGAAANDSVVRFPKNFEVGEMVVRKNAQGQYLEVTVAPKGPSSATPKSPLRK